MAFLTDNALDSGVGYLDTNGERLVIMSTSPANYAGVAAITLGTKGPTIGVPENGAVSGRRVIISAITDGSVTAWRIWYDDGSTYDSSQGPVEAAPLDGVLAVADEQKLRPRAGKDYYLWLGDSWAIGNQADLDRWLRSRLPMLKYGRWALKSVYDETITRAATEWMNRGNQLRR